MKDWLKKHGLYTIGVCIAFVVYLLNPFSTINYRMQDFLYQHPGKPHPNIYVIGVDDKTLQEYGPWNSWSRTLMADLLNKLNAAPESKPAVIGLDVNYFGKTTTEADQILTEAIREGGNVVMADQIVYSNPQLIEAPDGTFHLDTMKISEIQYPEPPMDVESAAHGFTNVMLDKDGIVRTCLHSVEFDGKTEYNFAYQIYQTYLKQTGQGTPQPPPVDKNQLWNLSYSAKAGAYGEGLSFADVMAGKIPAELFKDSIVLVGAYTSGMLDQYFTPVSRNVPMNGVEINANMVQALLEQKYKQGVPVMLQAILLVVCLLLCRKGYQYGVAGATTILVLFTIGYGAFGVLLEHFGWIIAPLYVPLFALIYYVLKMVINFLKEEEAKLQAINTFKRYVSPEVAEHLLQERRDALSDTVKRHIAVMFIDIRGFTPLSESLTPEQVVEILDEYLTLTSSRIFANGGTVDKFVGDATMALFNAPLDQEDYIYQAVKSATEIAAAGEALKDSLRERYGRTVSFGIGVHCGEAVVGNIGAQFRMDYTAIGDTVNTSARLESVAGPGQVLVSREVCEALEGRIEVTFVGTKQLKGKAQPTELFQVDRVLG